MGVCQIVILTMQGLLMCGATGDIPTKDMFTPGYQRVFDSEQGPICVPTDDMIRALDVPMNTVVQKVRLDAVKPQLCQKQS